MSRWLQRFTVFVVIAGLIIGGLGWATAEALRMEEDQRQVQAQKERDEKIRRALWRLDGMIASQLGRENSRPFAHYNALHYPVPALTSQGVLCAPGSVRVPSPLLDVDLPPWMLLHFQYTPANKEEERFQSPQVLPSALRDRLHKNPFGLTLANVTPEREELLLEFRRKYAHQLPLVETLKRLPTSILSEQAAVDDKGLQNSLNINWAQGNQIQSDLRNNDGQASQLNPVPQAAQYADPDRKFRQDVASASRAPRGKKEIDPGTNFDSVTSPRVISAEVGDVQLTSMTPLWFPSSDSPDYLLYVRLANFGKKDIVQGLIIDWVGLRNELQRLIVDLFPDGRLLPLAISADPGAAGVMSTLPVQLDPGPLPVLPETGLTPLRLGLGVAWAAVLLALAAMGLSAWSLIDLSERRIRFVSAVTHELRTPLTTLRLYLDMLTSGLVRDSVQKDEYLHTLNTESERLHRLISNVLDFARLEKQSARPAPADISLKDLVEQLNATWRDRCEAAGKELVLENGIPQEISLHTDSVLVQQILGNLIDNACKYSKCAQDRRVWLRAVNAGSQRVAFEVEDCGPGVSRREGRSIFRPFRRGHGADVIAGGVGLGLALARRWAAMLGGKLDVTRGQRGGGACFRLELPA